MSVLDIEIPPFTPMYHKIWGVMARELPLLVVEAGYPAVVRYQIVNERNAVGLDTQSKMVWHHLCHPRKMYEFIKDREAYPLSYGDNLKWELTLSYAYLNRNHALEQCRRCDYLIDRNTRNLLRMEALGMLVK